MSSAINHKKRSCRGHMAKTAFLAPKRSPLVSRVMYEQRKTFRDFMARLFRHMKNRKGEE